MAATDVNLAEQVAGILPISHGGNGIGDYPIDGAAQVILTAAYTLTSQTAAQKLFNASTNGAVTLGIGEYVFECLFTLSSMSTTSGSFGFALGGAATIAAQEWMALANKAALGTAAAPQATVNTAANTTLATATITATGWAYVRGLFRLSASGTIIPQVSLGIAAAAIVGAGSYFRAQQVNSSATATTVGTWT